MLDAIGFVSQADSRQARVAVDTRRRLMDEAEESIGSCRVERAPRESYATSDCASAWKVIRRTDRDQDADSAVWDGIDRRGRFDLREGHDLERLLWPEAGSGDSTGLLQNLAVDGRHLATVEPI